MHNITPKMRTYRYAAPVAAGVDGARVTTLPEIDMRGYKAARVVIVLGAVSASGVITTYLKNYAVTATPGSGTIGDIGAALTNSAAAAGSSKCIIREVHNPKNRFLRLDYQRTGGNVVIDSIIVELFNPDDLPVAQASADVDAWQLLNDPTPSTT